MDPRGPDLSELSALTDPLGTINAAQSQLESVSDPAGTARLKQLIGIVQRMVGSGEESVATLEEAVLIARAAGDLSLSADVQVTLAGSQATTGHLELALETLDIAEEHLSADRLPVAWMQRGSFVARSGSFDEALRLFGLAEPRLESSGDNVNLQALLSNRGLVHVYTGNLKGAERDLRRSLEIGTRLGLRAIVADTTHNLGWVRSRRGDLVGGLELFDQAASMLEAIDYPLNELLVDRAEVLLTARLLAEATKTAARAVEEVQAHGNPIDVPEAWVMYARAALAAGHADEAAVAAATAFEGFVGLEAEGWQAIATMLRAEADAMRGRSSTEKIRASIATASETGWSVAAFEGELLAASISTAEHDPAAAIEALKRADTILPPDRQPATLRARRLAAEAFGRAAAGESSKAGEKATEALSVLADFRAAIAATDLRASTSELAVDVVHLLVDLLAEQDQYDEMVQVVDTARASITNPPPVKPPSDPDITPLLGSVRELASEAQGEMSEEDAVPETLVEAERTYQAAVRPADRQWRDLTLPDDTIGLALMSGTERLIGVTIDGDSITPTSATPLDTLHGLLDELRASLVRPVEHWDDIVRITSSIDTLVIPQDLARDRSIVISPPAWMVTFPWTLLPSLRDRAVTVAPRLSNFVAADDLETDPPASALLVAGPHLETGIEELGRVGSSYTDAQTLIDPAAEREAVLAQLAATDVLHVASHARFRADNPLFSYLELSDGSLHVHELEGAGTVPDIVVLAACDSAAVAGTGLEFTGFVSVLLGLGVRTVVAAVSPVPDTSTTSAVMASFHEHLSSGERPSVALAEARRSAPDTPLGTLSAHTFQVFGWG